MSEWDAHVMLPVFLAVSLVLNFLQLAFVIRLSLAIKRRVEKSE